MDRTLYSRLGGQPGIKVLVDDIIEAHMNNPTLGPRFLPYREKPAELDAAKAHLCDFLGAGAGGPEEYTGRDMVTAHRGMNISPAEYMAALDDIMATLTDHKIDDQTCKDVLMISFTLKSEIVGQ